jgi:hypothetical protein
MRTERLAQLTETLVSSAFTHLIVLKARVFSFTSVFLPWLVVLNSRTKGVTAPFRY